MQLGVAPGIPVVLRLCLQHSRGTHVVVLLQCIAALKVEGAQLGVILIAPRGKSEPPLAALLRLAAATVAAAMAAAGSCSPSSSCSAALLRILRFLGFPSMRSKACEALQGPDVL